MRSQKGQAFIFVLIFLTLGTFAIVPNLQFLYTVIVGQRVSEEHLTEQYAADAALEDAFWQIMNDDLLDNLDPDTTPTYEYDFQPDFFDGDIPITIEYAEAPPSDWSVSTWLWSLTRMKAEVDPPWVEKAASGDQTFTYTIFADNTAPWWWPFSYDLEDAGTILPGSLEYVEGSTYHWLADDYDLDDPDSWGAGTAYDDPVTQFTDLDTWEDGTPTWTEINSSASTDIESNGDVTLSYTLGPPVSDTTTYNFTGVTTSNDGINGNPIAIEHDTDNFPWTSSGQQNDSANPSSTEYSRISADNTSQWETDDPGSNDEMAITYRFFIQEDVSDIDDIEITWNGNTDDGSANHSIWLRQDGEDEFGGTSTWDQLGSSLSIPADTDTDLIRTLDTDFATYVNDTTGQFEFVVTHSRSSSNMRTNYVQVKVDYTTQSRVYDTPGDLVSDSITVVDLDQWNEFTFDADQPANTTVTFKLQYWDGDSWEVIPNTALTGNEAGFAYNASPIDLTGLDVGTYDELRIWADLSTTDTSVTPTVDDWQITAVDADSKREIIWEYDTDEIEIDRGDTYIIQFEAEGSPNWGLHYTEPWVSAWGYDRLFSGPSGPVSIGLYHVSIEAGGKTVKAVIGVNRIAGTPVTLEVTVVSYQIYG